MYISIDRPATPVWDIYVSSPNSDAAFITSAAYLTDGKVSIPGRFTWDTGTQSNTDGVGFEATFASFTIPKDAYLVAALLMPKTAYAVPVGANIDFSFGVSLGIVGGTEVVQTDTGANVAIVVIQNTTGSAQTITSIKCDILNVVPGGATWATPGQTVDIGEIWFGTLQEFKNTTEPKRALIDGITNRRSHNNTNQPLFGQKPYHQWTYGFTPMPNATAYSSSAVPTYSQVEYSLSQSKSALILGRIYKPGTTTPAPDDLKFFMAFGRPATNGLQQMQAVKDGPYWVAGLVFETQPP